MTATKTRLRAWCYWKTATKLAKYRAIIYLNEQFDLSVTKRSWRGDILLTTNLILFLKSTFIYD